MKFYSLLFSVLLLASCSNSALEKELAETKEKLAQTEASLATDKDDNDDENTLVHVVYFKLKPDADQVKLIEEINKLKDIEVLNDLEIGLFEDLGDQRALSDYQLMMSMEFENEEDYKIYQAHELHLGLKEVVGEYLAGPPATYDYMEQ